MYSVSAQLSANREKEREEKNPPVSLRVLAHSLAVFHLPPPSLCPHSHLPLPTLLLFLSAVEQTSPERHSGGEYIHVRQAREKATRATVGSRERRKNREGETEGGRGEGFQWVKRGRWSQSTPALFTHSHRQMGGCFGQPRQPMAGGGQPPPSGQGQSEGVCSST